jgi:hypothetical protein
METYLRSTPDTKRTGASASHEQTTEKHTMRVGKSDTYRMWGVEHLMLCDKVDESLHFNSDPPFQLLPSTNPRHEAAEVEENVYV